jgi:hypothetical protein
VICDIAVVRSSKIDADELAEIELTVLSGTHSLPTGIKKLPLYVVVHPAQCCNITTASFIFDCEGRIIS